MRLWIVLCLAFTCLGVGHASKRSEKLLGQASEFFDKGQYRRASSAIKKIPKGSLLNEDMRLFLLGQSQFMLGEVKAAETSFASLSATKGRFTSLAKWKLADCLWEQEKFSDAEKKYRDLIKNHRKSGDVGLASYRIAEFQIIERNNEAAAKLLKEFRLKFPSHVLEPEAEKELRRIKGNAAGVLSARDRIKRAQILTETKFWNKALDELEALPKGLGIQLEAKKKYRKGMNLFGMRRHYKLASDLLLEAYKHLDAKDGSRALFHGARALSRADFDQEAVKWYQDVVKIYPRSDVAAEAQFLSGWLEFNLGHYKKAIPYLKEMLEKYPRSKFAVEALWYWGFCHYLDNDFQNAKNVFEKLSKKPGKEAGGKGHYWLARTMQKLGAKGEAQRAYAELVGRFPFSWYALLANARLEESGGAISPFGKTPRDPNKSLKLGDGAKREFSGEPSFRKSKELVRAGLKNEASKLLAYHQKSFLRKHRKNRGKALSALMGAYREAGNYNRPWMISVVHGGDRALHAPAKGNAKSWWKNAYPMAYDGLIEKFRELGKNPKYYLNTIMRKESGFNPHTHSYADARGLVQMIPKTTKIVARELGLDYLDGSLFDPEFNVKTGAWYIGRLHHKFSQQIPIGAGSFNSGPRPVMRWLDKNGDRPMDEFVELVSFKQARNYMRRTTETYARYLNLYENKVYIQPLTVSKDYLKNELTY